MATLTQQHARSRLPLWLATMAAAVVFSQPAAMAIEINGYSAARNSRFSAGYPTAPLANLDPMFIGAGYDWSAVGWSATNSSYSATLVGPRHVLIANHYLRPAQLCFSSGDGQVHTFTVQEYTGPLGDYTGYANPPDLAMGLLAEPVPTHTGIQPATILFMGYSVSGSSPYYDLPMLVYGAYAAVGYGKLYGIRDGLFSWGGKYFTYAFDLTTPDRARLQFGDSSSPSFFVTGANGQMYLAGSHFLIYGDAQNSAYGVDTAVPLMLADINRYMANTGYLAQVVTPITARWTNATGTGQWSNAANWSPGGVPADSFPANDDTRPVTATAAVLLDAARAIPGPEPYTVTLGGTAKVTGISFAPAAGSNGFVIGTGGERLLLGEAGITNRDDQQQRFDCDITLRSWQRWNVGPGGLKVTGNINLAHSEAYLLVIEGQGTAELTGVISAVDVGSNAVPGGLSLYGPGKLVLSGPGNTYAGKTFVLGGTLSIGRDEHLGAGPSAFSPDHLTLDGGTLQVRAGTPVSLHQNRGVALGFGGGTIAVDAGQTLTVQGGIGGLGDLVLRTGDGSGQGTMVLAAPAEHYGLTTVRNATLTLRGASGAVVNSPWIELYSGRLRLDNSAGNPTVPGGRLPDATPLKFNSATLEVAAHSSGSSETIGDLLVESGENTYWLAAGAGSTVLSNGQYLRSPGAVLNFTSSSPLGAGNQIRLAGQSAGFIDQGTFVDGMYYAVYSSAGHVRAMTAGAGQHDYATSVIPDRHVRLTSTPAAQSSVELKTLTLHGGVNFLLAPGAELTLSEGGLVKSGGGTSLLSGDWLVSPTELVIRTASAADILNLNASVLISSSDGITKCGPGTVVLGGFSNLYLGPTTVTDGTLKAGTWAAIPEWSPLVLTGAGKFDLAGFNQTVARVTIEDGAILNSGLSAALTLAGHTGGITYSGVGSGGNISVQVLNLASPGSPQGAHLFTVADGQGVDDLTISSQIVDGAATPQALVKAGPGTLKLTGTNSYTGGTTVLEGTLAIGSSGALPAGQPLSIGGGTLDLRGHSITVGDVVTLDGGAIIGGTLTAFEYQLRSGSISATLAGPAAVVKSGPGVVVLSGSNTYSQGSYLNEGVLEVTHDANLGDAGSPLIFGGGTLRVVGSGLASTTRPVVWGSAGGIFDIAEQGHVFSLPAQSLQSAGRLTKTGLGVLRLGGSISSTEIVVADGTLRLAGNNLLAANPAVTIHPSAVLDLDGYNASVGSLTMLGGAVKTGAGTLTLAGNVSYQRSIWPARIEGNLNLGGAQRTFDVARGASTDASGYPNDLAITANISGSGGLTKTGSGTLILGGTNTFSGPTIVNGGVLRYSAFQAVSGSSVITVAAGGYAGLATSSTSQLASFLARFDKTSSRGVIGIDGNLAAGTIDLTGFHDDVRLGSSSAGLIPVGSTIIPQGMHYRFGGGGGTLTVAASLDGSRFMDIGTSGSLPAGTVVLAGANTYAGLTTVTAGILKLGNSVALGSTSAATFVSSGAVLDLNGQSGVPEPIIINGHGVLFPLQLSNIYSGALTNSSVSPASLTGTVTLGSDSTIGTMGAVPGTLTLSGGIDTTAAGHTLTFSGPAGINVLGGGISGSGSIIKTGTGMLTISAVCSYTGSTTVQEGTLRINGGNDRLPTSTSLIINGGTLDLFGREQQVGSLSGSASAVIVNNSGASGTATLTVAGSGTYAGAIRDGNTGKTALTKTAAGLLALTGTNTYTGPTRVLGGTLRANDGVNLPAGSNLMLSGGVLETSAAFSRALGTGPGQVQIPGGASGLSAYGAAVNVNLSSAATLLWGSALFNPTTLVLNDVTANNTITLHNPIDLNGLTRTIDVRAATAVLAGAVSNSGGGAAGLTKTGAGTLVLAAPQNYNGPTTVAAGVLQINAPNTALSDYTVAAGAQLNVNTALHIDVLDGAGSTIIAEGAQLTAALVQQSTVTILGTPGNPGKLVLSSSAGTSGNTLFVGGTPYAAELPEGVSASQTAVGQYIDAATTAPVPEPATCWLAISGLLAAAGAAVVRTRTNAASRERNRPASRFS